jgi:hypothetical protein
MASVQISAEDYQQLLAAAAERDALKAANAELQDDRDMWKYRAEQLRQQLYQQQLHTIEGSMYLHDLNRGDKTEAKNLPTAITTESCGTKLFIKPSFVGWNERGNEGSRKSWHNKGFYVETLAEITGIYKIKECEKAVKEAFKSNGWKQIGGQEYFGRPADKKTLKRMIKVFRDTIQPFTVAHLSEHTANGCGSLWGIRTDCGATTPLSTGSICRTSGRCRPVALPHSSFEPVEAYRRPSRMLRAAPNIDTHSAARGDPLWGRPERDMQIRPLPHPDGQCSPWVGGLMRPGEWRWRSSFLGTSHVAVARRSPMPIVIHPRAAFPLILSQHCRLHRTRQTPRIEV